MTQAMDAFRDSFDRGRAKPRAEPGRDEGARRCSAPTVPSRWARWPRPCAAMRRTSRGSPTASRPAASWSATPHPTDRRVKTLSLTDAGRAAHEQAHELLRAPPAPLLALSAAELRTLRDLMTKCWEQAPGDGGLTRPHADAPDHDGVPARQRRAPRQEGRARAHPPRARPDPARTAVRSSASSSPSSSRPRSAVVPALLFRALLDDAVGSKDETLVLVLALAAVGVAVANAVLSLAAALVLRQGR